MIQHYKLVNCVPTPCDGFEYPTPDERRVAWTDKNDIQVSTVFLPIDHGFGGKPLWFETMVFGGELHGECDRYTTYEEAEEGHAEMCKKVFGE